MRWTDASSGWRTSTGSRARSAGSGGCRRTRWPGTCSGAWSPGAAAATCSCATAPGSTWTWAAIPSTPPRSATTSPTWWSTTRPASGSWKACWSTRTGGCAKRASPGDIYLFKNNTDSAGNSYGCHENYLVGRHGEFGRLADILIPFLVTRQVICGAGQGAADPARRGVLRQPAGRAHLGGRVVGHHPVPADHQHPRRAARRRRAVPAAARHRRRLEHERDHHAAQGGRHRPGAAHDRGGHGHARPDAWRTRSGRSGTSATT